MEATNSELTLLAGIGSMAMGIIGALALMALESPGAFWTGMTLVGMGLGIVAVIRKGNGHEFGIVGLACGLLGLVAFFSGISLLDFR